MGSEGETGGSVAFKASFWAYIHELVAVPILLVSSSTSFINVIVLWHAASLHYPGAGQWILRNFAFTYHGALMIIFAPHRLSAFIGHAFFMSGLPFRAAKLLLVCTWLLFRRFHE